MRMIAGIILTAMLLTTAASAELPAQPAGLTLEKVAMFMRHGIRPPTKEPPAGLADQPWPAWPVPYGNLTDRGAEGAALLGGFDRQFYATRGLLDAKGCPAPGQVVAQASAKERAIRTAESLLKGLAPGCTIDVTHPQSDDQDVVFHPLGHGSVQLDPAKALAAAAAHQPPGGLGAEVAQYRTEFDILQRALGVQSPQWCGKRKLPAGCRIIDLPTALETDEEEGRPDAGGAFALASTVSQTFLLEYLEGKPMQDVAWGRVTRADIEAMLRFHPVKFKYENRPPYIADRAAGPILRQIAGALKDGGARLFLMVGHDTNIADIAGMLDLHWRVDSYPADDTPPGGGIGFELLRNRAGQGFIRAFYRAQTMDQLRALRPLDLKGETASLTYLDLPLCARGADRTICTAADFFALVDAKITATNGP